MKKFKVQRYLVEKFRTKKIQVPKNSTSEKLWVKKNRVKKHFVSKKLFVQKISFNFYKTQFQIIISL